MKPSLCFLPPFPGSPDRRLWLSGIFGCYPRAFVLKFEFLLANEGEYSALCSGLSSSLTCFAWFSLSSRLSSQVSVVASLEHSDGAAVGVVKSLLGDRARSGMESC